MPVHCAERWLKVTLDSVTAEAGPDVEIIVIDGSPDRATAEIVNSYADRLSLELIPRTDLPDWRAKTNFGVQRAKASHVCTLHQDDVWMPGRVKAIREWIAADPDVALHLAPTAIIDLHGRRLGTWRCPLPTGSATASPIILERLLVQNFVAIPSPVFRRDAWIACGGLDLDLWYTADWDMWLKLADYGPVRYHDDVTAAFRVHGSSLTMTGSRQPNEFEDQMRIVLERHLERHPDWCSHSVARVARASIDINVALAAASTGSAGALTKAVGRLIALGPRDLRRYLRDSRLWDRALPRLRAKMSGAL
jgi:glycosyltransferase involved in cell wall biosynthesis